jgi:membrane protease YdiL (CAAX protease family)
MHDRSEASGLQIAFLTLAIALLSAPLARWILQAVGLTWGKDTMPRLLTLSCGAIVVAAFPAARRRALSYFRQPIRNADNREVAAVALANLLVPFAVLGALVIWHAATWGASAFESNAVSAKWIEEQSIRSCSREGLLLLFTGVLVAPVVEELVFRGFLFDAWQRRWGWLVSAVLTSTVFALYHHLFLNAFVISLVFICVLRRTGSLRAPMIVHAVGNLLLWYPLVGHFVFPQAAPGPDAWHVWLPHMIALASVLFLLPAYLFLASTRPAAKMPASVVENGNPA